MICSTIYKEKMFNVAVGVRYKGSTIFKKGYGKGNFETGTSFIPTSHTGLASVSKHFAAKSIMILWKDGKLQLDDNINKYFDLEVLYQIVKKISRKELDKFLNEHILFLLHEFNWILSSSFNLLDALYASGVIWDKDSRKYTNLKT